MPPAPHPHQCPQPCSHPCLCPLPPLRCSGSPYLGGRVGLFWAPGRPRPRPPPVQLPQGANRSKCLSCPISSSASTAKPVRLPQIPKWVHSLLVRSQKGPTVRTAQTSADRESNPSAPFSDGAGELCLLLVPFSAFPCSTFQPTFVHEKAHVTEPDWVPGCPAWPTKGVGATREHT